MTNPFYVHPAGDYYNYFTGLANTVGAVAQQRELRKQQEAEAQQGEQKKKEYADAVNTAMQAYQSNDPDAIAAVNIKYPVLAKEMQLRELAEHKNEKVRDNYLAASREFIGDPSPENFNKAINYWEASRKLSGADAEGLEKQKQSFVSMYQQDPEKFRQRLLAQQAATDTKWYTEYKEAIGEGPEKTADLPTPTDIDDFVADAEVVFKAENPEASNVDLARFRNNSRLLFKRAQTEEVSANRFAVREADASTAQRIAYNGQLGTELAKIATVNSMMEAKGEVSPVQKQQSAQKRLSGNLATLADKYLKLDSMGGIVNIENPTFENVTAAAKSSRAGQKLGEILGTEEQSMRQSIRNMVPLLVQEIRQTTDMGARGMDSEKELQFYLQAATNEKVDLQSNLAAIAVLDQTYGTGSIADLLSDKVNQEAVGRIKARGASVLAGEETVIMEVPGFGKITEADVRETMRSNNMTREQVLQELELLKRQGLE